MSNQELLQDPIKMHTIQVYFESIQKTADLNFPGQDTKYFDDEQIQSGTYLQTLQTVLSMSFEVFLIRFQEVLSHLETFRSNNSELDDDEIADEFIPHLHSNFPDISLVVQVLFAELDKDLPENEWVVKEPVPLSTVERFKLPDSQRKITDYYSNVILMRDLNPPNFPPNHYYDTEEKVSSDYQDILTWILGLNETEFLSSIEILITDPQFGDNGLDENGDWIESLNQQGPFAYKLAVLLTNLYLKEP